MLPRSALTLALLALAATALSAAVVTNPANPAGGVDTLTLQPMWRHGGLDDEQAFFGVINGAAVGPQGEVYLADSQLMTVHVVSPDGELLESLGRQGEGPGEVTRLGGVLPMPDGTVGLVQLMPGQVVKVEAGGGPAGTLIPLWPEEGGRIMLQELREAGGHLVASGRRMTRGEQGPMIVQWIAGLAPDGALTRFYYRHETGRNFASGVIRESDTDWPGEGRWTVTPDGEVIVAPERTEYRLDVVGIHGVERSFGREFVTRRRTAQEKATIEGRFSRFRRGRHGGRPGGITVEVMPDAADIEALFPRPGGEIWVHHSRSHLDQPAGVMLTYDVFDAEGNFTRQLAVECEGVAPRDLLVPLSDGSFVLIIGHADALAAMRGVENNDAEADNDIVLEVVGLKPAP